jgi:hypothetical protein
MLDTKMSITVSSQILINDVDKTEELGRLAEIMGLHRVIPGKYSSLFLVDLLLHMEYLGVNPFKIMDEVKALEGLSSRSHTKPATPFEHLPLEGLWHKHYFGTGPAALIKNIRIGLGKRGIEELAIAELSGDEITPEAINKFTHELVNGTFERRAAAGKLAGEWIIFAKHNGENYYLCLGGHTWGDDYIAARIREMCIPEFPFLMDILGPA